MTAERITSAAETPAEMSIEGTWLVEAVDGCTCGVGPHGYYGAHEPGCGSVPLVNLATLAGWTDLLAGAEARGAREATREASALLRRWESTPALRRGTAARELRAALPRTTQTGGTDD
ncbi:hypothetical protein [Xylanimonas protaetiae]|uniref:Uncharacterized protein n=1 Tax=Xylanimonas protaetiae TaxID=2509457 RepID=A0A4P6F417_9MICO|nr:hypothetical protein [Xylanimonas protaetiae]QAY70015.1 hypothetical protein ET471_08195 [Xylanimonas protaetiae]